MEIKDKGHMAMLTDPTGRVRRAVAADRTPGFTVVDKDGAPVYHQLTTRDYGKALDFYREVFGWHTERVADTDEFRYSTASFDGQALLGVMDGARRPARRRAVELVLLPGRRGRRQDRRS